MLRTFAMLAAMTIAAHAMPPDVTAIVTDEARSAGLDAAYLLAVADIESAGNCSARSGSYIGLFQLSNAEFTRLGGKSITDCRDNARIGAKKIAAEANDFREANGRDPAPVELYMIHQQGPQGMEAHYAHLDLQAWKSVWLYTAEGIDKGQTWSQLAIWGNLTPEAKAKFRGVDNVTSRQFVDFWRDRLEQKMAALAPPKSKESYECYVLPSELRKLRGK
jgi:hypothetical protein